MACFGWNTHPSAQGSSTLTPLSPQDSPLDPFRGVSSCEGPGGQTWKNTCKARVKVHVSPRLLARTTPYAWLKHPPPPPCSAAPKHGWWRRDLAFPGYTGALKVSVGTRAPCRWVVTLGASQHPSATSGYKPHPRDW